MRLFKIFHVSQADRDLEEELQFHVAHQIELNLAAGMSPEEARRQALLAFGAMEATREQCREERSGNWFETVFQDVRYGLRLLRKSPGFTTVAVLTLALGIGANAAIFSLIDAVMLRMLPIKDPQQLVQLGWGGRTRGTLSTHGYGAHGLYFSLSYPFFQQLRTNHDVFSSVAAFQEIGDSGTLNLSVDGQAYLGTGEMVSGNYFLTLGVSPEVGRTLSEADESPSAPRTVVISDRLWRSRFGSDPAAIGKVIAMNSVPFTIVGVAPARFAGLVSGHSADLWIPISDQAGPTPWAQREMEKSPLIANDYWWAMVVGRLNPGITRERAEAEVNGLFQRYVIANLGSKKLQRLPFVKFEPADKGLQRLRYEFSKPLFVLMTIVGLVLLIACANVSTLLLSRAAARQREIGIRLALGASRIRIIRQLLIESVLLAFLGGALGVAMAYSGASSLAALITSGTGLRLDVHLNYTVLLFAFCISVCTGILFGLAPAFPATQVEVTPALKESTGSSFSTALTRFRLGRLLVIGQVFVSLFLLIAAGLFVGTLKNLESVDTGFDRRNLLTFAINPVSSGYSESRVTTLYSELLQRLRNLPGVQKATIIEFPLLSGAQSSSGIQVESYTPKPGEIVEADWNIVGPQFLETMSIPLLLGRDVEDRDTEHAPPVAVINEAMAKRFFGESSSIGHTFSFDWRGWPGLNKTFQIIGVAKDAKYSSVRDQIHPTAYLPYRQAPLPIGALYFAVRIVGSPATEMPSIQRKVRDVAPGLPLFDIRTQADIVNESLAQERLFAQLCSFFGVLALLLACIGLYGTIAYSVARRRTEIGVRIALGARPLQVLWMVLRQSLVLVAIGICLGIPAAIAIGRIAGSVVSGLLFGLKATDPFTIGMATIIMIAIATIAGYLPARRAAHIDPIVALRYE